METALAIRARNRSIGFILLSILNSATLANSIPVLAGTPPLAKHTLTHQSLSHSRYGIPTFANSTDGDIATFEDPIVRQAAIKGLGRYNGSVVALIPIAGESYPSSIRNLRSRMDSFHARRSSP